jgi:penicillin-binding protein 1A
VAKFTSWFKERAIKSSDESNPHSSAPSTDEPYPSVESQESRNDVSPTKQEKVRQLLSQMKSVSSAILAKLPGKDKPLYRRSWFWTGVGLSSGIVAVNYGLWTIDRTLPQKAEINSVVREQTLTIKAADGTILQQQGEISREQLRIEQIPDKLKKAFIASEDRRFAQHNGVDFQGIARAVINNVRSQNVIEGGSTITQQLARILFLKQEPTITRKLKEARLAQKIEQELTKDQILERYLNLVYLGSGAYGIADAAYVHFSKTVDQLTIGEMATIAGLAPAPSKFSPQVSIEAAKARRNLVLHRMQEDGVITADERSQAQQEELTLKPSQPKRLEVQAPYFTTYIQKELPKYVSPEALKAGGLTVETTLNPEWQKAAEEAVAKTLRNQGRWENFKQAALVAIDPRSGEIKAMVGGKDFGKYQFNRVTQAQRQPGSTFKGFVYATAIASGMSPYQNFVDAPLIVDGYEPKNYDEGFRGSMNMTQALTKSINIIAVKVLMKVGFEPTIKLAHNMGIKSQLKPTYSLALGSNEVNLLELTSAYGTFATQGLHKEAHGIRRIFNRHGQEIWTAKYKPKRALDANSAAITTWMLRNVVEAGTGAAAQLGARPVAGKTGTSDEARDLWFIGYIPQLATGVWLGNDDNKPTWGSSSSAAYTWHEFMKEAVEGMDVEKFPPRPKLDGRKGSIKALPVKARRIVNRPVPVRRDDDDDNETRRSRRSADEDSSRSRRSRRRYSQPESQSIQQPEETPRRRRRRRRSQENQVETNDTPRRSSRRRSETQSTSNDSYESRPRRRRNRIESDSSAPPRVRSRRRRSAPESSGSSGSRNRRSNSGSSSDSSGSSSQPSWRERLRPSE